MHHGCEGGVVVEVDTVNLSWMLDEDGQSWRSCMCDEDQLNSVSQQQFDACMVQGRGLSRMRDLTLTHSGGNIVCTPPLIENNNLWFESCKQELCTHVLNIMVHHTRVSSTSSRI